MLSVICQESVAAADTSTHTSYIPVTVKEINCRCWILSRFVMLKGSSGFYCYAIFEHNSSCPALNVSEARLAFKLNADMSVLE